MQNCDFNRRMVEPTKLWVNRCSSLGRNDLSVGSRRASVAIADWTRRGSSSDSGCGAASQSIGTGPSRKRTWNKELFEQQAGWFGRPGRRYVAEQMEQARKKNEEWIRQQAKAEATRESMRIAWTSSNANYRFMQSFDKPKSRPNLLKILQQLKTSSSIRKRY